MDKFKRIAALTGVILLLGLYLVTFIVAILNRPGSENLLMVCIWATFVIPICIYGLQLLYKAMHKK